MSIKRLSLTDITWPPVSAAAILDYGRLLFEEDQRRVDDRNPIQLQEAEEKLITRLAGYEDAHDAERLAVDLTMRNVVGGRATERTAASESKKQLARLCSRKRITKEAHAGRGQETKWEMSVNFHVLERPDLAVDGLIRMGQSSDGFDKT